MSRSYSKNTSNYTSLGAAAINPLISGASAVTLFAWGRPSSFTAGANGNRIISAVIDAGATGPMLAVGNGSGHVLRVGARSAAGDGFQTRDSVGTISTGAWVALGGVIDFAAGTITPYIGGSADNGGAATFGLTAYTPGTPTSHDGIGSSFTGSTPTNTGNQWDGPLAHIAIWVAALTSQEMADLAAGANPGAIRTASLVSYHRLAGYDSPEPNAISGGPSATITGSVPAGGSDPAVYQPWRRARRPILGAA